MGVFFVECKTEYSLDLIVSLSKTQHCVTWAGSHMHTAELENLRKKRPEFNAIKIVNSPALYRRKTLKQEYKSYFQPLNPEILSYFSSIERDFYILTDRGNYESVSFRERKLYFRDLIRFWMGFLQREDIEAVYCPYAPHVGWELVLMQASRFLGLPFAYFSHTAINNRSLLRESYKDIPIVPGGYLKGLSVEDIRSQIDPALLKDFEEGSLVTEAVKAENDAFNKQSVNTSRNLTEKFQKSRPKISMALRIKRIAGPVYYALFERTKRRFYLPLSMDEHSSLSIWSRALRRHRVHAARLKSYYESHTGNIDLEQPYVYFPMHLQPEMTTQPEAGIYEDHYLVLEQILAALPEGWKIYVKENPRQYDTSINAVSAMHFRDIQDLKDLLDASPAIHFVPQSVSTPDLIQNAQAVVTQTGTVGWECLTSGKPCIAFARPWYSGCRSCLRVNNAEDLRAAFQQVPHISPEKVQADLMRFLHFYQNELFIGSLSDPTNVAYNTRPYDELISGHKQRLLNFFESGTGKDQSIKRTG
ncbi:MAG: hypothetical protein H6853_00235 [Rhodospirillales bacterium]|nr:hypothetical protein [Alphaproteobacteria bacterium]USO03755.1 MAG: hypothetical protein H6853_00235 [Rhodospirillales bacterium]